MQKKKKNLPIFPCVPLEGSQKLRYIITFILSCISHDFGIEYAEVSSALHISLGDIV